MKVTSINEQINSDSETQQSEAPAFISKQNQGLLSSRKQDTDLPVDNAINDKPKSKSQLGKFVGSVLGYACFILVLITIKKGNQRRDKDEVQPIVLTTIGEQMQQQEDIFNAKPNFQKYEYSASSTENEATLISDFFWLSSLFGDSVLLPATNATSETISQIENNLKNTMVNSVYNDKLFSGTYKFQNLVHNYHDEVYYYDIWLTAGNLTAKQHELFADLDTFQNSEEDKWLDNKGHEYDDIEDDLNGFARIIMFQNLAQDIGEELDFEKSELNKLVYLYEGQVSKGKLDGYGRQFEVNGKAYKTEMGFFEANNLSGKGIIWNRLVATRSEPTIFHGLYDKTTSNYTREPIVDKQIYDFLTNEKVNWTLF